MRTLKAGCGVFDVLFPVKSKVRDTSVKKDLSRDLLQGCEMTSL
jgi:hypothetical protein